MKGIEKSTKTHLSVYLPLNLKIPHKYQAHRIIEDSSRLFAKKHTSQNLRYHYVITEIGKPVISRCNHNSGKNADIVI